MGKFKGNVLQAGRHPCAHCSSQDPTVSLAAVPFLAFQTPDEDLQILMGVRQQEYIMDQIGVPVCMPT